ncbi:nuclear transport factor 2 family protein [Oceanibaculum nanhaiense]|uniref:nuclear transport factor 2 family protein n=1 Tax=Oceanibaculum nanhaiense TaxID=1909734 RepID=UPI0025A3C51B|nr:nuclear transport factor 2 family protein [Oceanibaculum nanhaiense]MDM7946275.1 nuclear transport factor 2 family protein [Oceanibaculum nanhaiense]
MKDAVAAYGRFFETIAPDSLDRLDGIVAPDVRFVDPFNDVTGIEGYRAVFRHMFETVDQPRFTILRTATDGDTAFYRWRFSFRRKGAVDIWTIEGMSEVRFLANGLVAAHIDHWDAASQLYERLPVIGALLRWIRRKLAV